MSSTLINKGFKPLSQLAVFLGVFGVSLIAAAIASFGVAALTGLPLTNPDLLMQPKYASALRILQVVSTLFIFGLPAILFSIFCYRNNWQALGFGQKWQWSLAVIAVLIMIAAGPLTDLVATLNKAIPLPADWRSYFDGMEKTYETQVKAMLDVSDFKGLCISLLLVAALPALVEELFFRGVIQGLLSRWWASPWLAIAITSIIFSAIHFSWYGFFPRIMLGALLGAVFYITGNIWYSILMHFINNAAAVIFMYTLQLQGKPLDMSSTTVFPAWAGMIAAFVVVFLVRVLYKKSPPIVRREIMESRNNPFNQPVHSDSSAS